MLKKLSHSNFMIPSMVVLAILATSAGFYISLKQSQTKLEQNNIAEGLFWPNPKQLLEFNTTDNNGELFGLKQIEEKWSFIFFGYTNCPDICPITMSVMADTYKRIKNQYKNVQVIFVTVDPERDDTEKLNSYVSFFDSQFIGLNGSPQIKNSLTKQIGVAFYHDDKKGNYLVDHSASIFVIDPKMRLVSKLSPPHNSEEIIKKFKKIKRFIDEKS